MNIELFKELAGVFAKHGYKLYLVGGSVRDYLIASSFSDADCVTDASLESMKKFLKVKSEFPLFQSGKFIFKGKEFDITSMRKEINYEDFRHPKRIERVSSPIEEYSRRDFTINALYMDENEVVYDYSTGISDLEKKLIKCIGSPNVRLREDPLRILRAIRFAHTLNFEIDEELVCAIKANIKLLRKLNYNKIKEELGKFLLPQKELLEILKNYDIDKVIPLNYLGDFKKAVNYINYEKSMSIIDLLNAIQKNETFINVISVEDLYDIFFIKNGLLDFPNFIEEITQNTDFNNCFSKRKYLLVFKIDGEEINEECLFLTNKEIDNIQFIDSNYGKIKNKKRRNAMYYESFINLLKVLSKR